MNIELLTLRGKIKGLTEESLRICSLLKKSKGDEKFCLWDIKRQIGKETRYHLLAYAILRGIPHYKVERNTNEERLQPYNFDYDYLLQIINHHCIPYEKCQWTPKKIQDWIFDKEIQRSAA